MRPVMVEKVKIPRLAKRMKATGQILCAGFTTQGSRVFWLEPSQKKVSAGAALRAIACPIVRPLDGGLFGDQPQSYQVAP